MQHENKNQVVKVSPGGLLPGSKGGETSPSGPPGGEADVILGFRVPTTSKSKKFDDHHLQV